jgi:two-component system, OmpR family, sensor histidine kinase KdpD
VTETDRPRPEHFLSLIREQKLGRLKVYLGFAPGVGKTFEMLQEGQRLKRQGVDVVIGVVETHGRADTAAQVGDLEQVPRRRVEYRGVGLDEMDLDAVLKRRPAVVLVDELAHTNAPGSRFAKRYQDVEELLRQGIHVITAMNVQHLESLCDMIERFAGVKVKERVPDFVLAQAHQIVNVDLPAEDLQERLAAGKIYPKERVERALGNFFTGPNLSRLRELALEEVAHLLDRQREKAGDTAVAGSERVAVLVSSRSPTAIGLLRKAARLADRLRAPWFAVYVQTPSERAERIDAETQRRVSDTLTLARQLGGVPVELKGDDFATAVAAYARQHAITHVVVGRTRRRGWRLWFGRSPLDRLLAAMPAVDVLVAGT